MLARFYVFYILDSDEHDEKHNGDDSGDDRDEGPLREQVRDKLFKCS